MPKDLVGGIETMFRDCPDEPRLPEQPAPVLIHRSRRQRESVQAGRVATRRAASRLLAELVALGHEDEVHGKRLAAWSGRLARELGLASERVLDIETGALLHNVGYLRLRAIAFQRPGPLTAGERFELHRHPAIGGRILQSIPGLHRAIPLVTSHHERYDGGGYPQRSRGSEIPIDGRIFHLVDAYEAMTSERPYRARKTDAHARTAIADAVGSQFDPVVQWAFASIPAATWLDVARSAR